MGRLLLLFIILGIFLIQGAHAKGLASFSEHQWNLKVGLGIYAATNIRYKNQSNFRKDDPILIPLPYIRLKLSRLEIMPDKVVWIFAKSLLWQLDMRANYIGHDYKTDGLAHRHNTIFGGVALRFLIFKFEVLKDLENKSKGTAYSTAAIIPIPLAGGSSITLQGEIEHWDGNYVNYYFGVKDSEATSTRPAYHGMWETDYYFQMISMIKITPHWIMRFTPGYRIFGPRIANSPTVTTKKEWSTVMGMVYEF